MSKNDKSNLIILATMIGIILLIFSFNILTVSIPITVLLIAIGLMSLFIIGVITKKYLSIYGINSSFDAYIPIYNLLHVFTPALARATLILFGICIVLVCVSAIHATIFMSIFGEVTAYKIVSEIPRLILLSILILWIVISTGLVILLKDVREMLTEIHQSKQPMLELIYYVIMYLPFASLASYAFTVVELNKVISAGYHPGDISDNNTDKFSEVC